MIKWLLDMNACIAIMNNCPGSVKQELMKQPVSAVSISAISLYELQYGVSKSTKVEQNQTTLAAFFKYIKILKWTKICAQMAGVDCYFGTHVIKYKT